MRGASASSKGPPRRLAKLGIPNPIWVPEGLPDISATLVFIAELDTISPMNAVATWFVEQCRISAAEYYRWTSAVAENHTSW
jgi:hypothetical protein